MKQNKGILFLVAVAVICFSGCTSYKGVRIVYPQYEQVVSELQPTLEWVAVPGSGVTYDLIIFKENEINPVFFKKGLTDTNHTIEKELTPGTWYRWSVRSRTGDTVSAWTKMETQVFTGVSHHRRVKFMKFSTPESP
jgi:hypothetical protein